jgi:hypothetical protein
MRTLSRSLLFTLVASTAACISTAAPDMVRSSGDTCIDDFVANTDLPNAQPIEASRPVEVGGTRLRLFEIRYGKANDCEAGCFYSRAIGLARGPCDKIGWIGVNDYEQLGKRRFSQYQLEADDAILLAPATWSALHVVLGDDQYERVFLRWLARHPEASPDLAARVAAEKQLLRQRRGY